MTTTASKTANTTAATSTDANPYDFRSAADALDEARDERKALAVWLADCVLNGGEINEHAIAIYRDAVALYDAARASYEIAATNVNG